MDRLKLIVLNFFICLFFLLYFMGRNQAEFLDVVYFKTIGQIFIFYLFLAFLSFCLNKWINLSKKFYYFFMFLLFLLFLIFSSTLLFMTFFINELLKTFILAYIVQSIVFLLWYYNKLKIAFLFIIMLCAYNAGIYFYKTRTILATVENDYYGDMNYKPNIYFIVLESYQGNEALKELYGYDNKEFLEYLERQDFEVYEDVYSIVAHTRDSLSSIFSMKNLDDIEAVFMGKCLSKPSQYKVSNTLLKNGYNFSYIFPTNYLNVYDDDCAYDSSLFEQFFIFGNKCSKLALGKLSRERITFELYMENLVQKMLLKKKDPFFFITKVGGILEECGGGTCNNIYYDGLNHIPAWARRSEKVELLPVLRASYIKELEKENLLLQRFIEKIKENDKNALIILFGDHGGDFFEVYKREYGEIDKFLVENNISKRDFILDHYNVLLAILWPDNLRGKKADIKVLPQLFKIIFERLIPNIAIDQPTYNLYDTERKLWKGITSENMLL